MKRVALCLMMMGCGIMLRAQTLEEWVRQKQTQIKYLVNQVAALQVYIELGQKGYGIYRDGLTFIGDIKDGEFNLHKNYFASLSSVNPGVGNSPKVEEMLRWNEQIKLFGHRVRQMELDNYSVSIRKLFDALMQKSEHHRQQLQLLIADGHYQLTDDERMGRLNALYQEYGELYGFAKSVCQDAVVQSKVLRKQEREIGIVEQLRGLK